MWTESCPEIQMLKPKLPKGTVSGDRAFMEVTQIKWGQMVGPHPIELGSLYEEEETHQGFPHRGKTLWGHIEKVALCKSRAEASGETTPAGTLILDFPPPEL